MAREAKVHTGLNDDDDDDDDGLLNDIMGNV